MTRKRGPNSPMESEKNKQSTSAVASTLGMAAVLSAVSHVFSSQGANSVVTDSEDEYQSQSHSQTEGGGNESETDRRDENPWQENNLNKSKVRSPKRDKDPLKPRFDHFSNGALRDEIEIEVLTKNGKKFTGSITPMEIKYGIYIECLKFPNHENFDGCRSGFKGKVVVTIKLIEPIDIDELSSVEYFDFIRTSTFRGKKIEETIGCKIKGVRYRQTTSTSLETPVKEDGRTMVKIEGCDYRIKEEMVIAWLEHYGKVESEMKEDEFIDKQEAAGNFRTGNYSVLMTLDKNIPQLLPMDGRRIKIYHRGIEKLCTKCFEKHRKSDCKAPNKVEWLDYVANFVNENPEIQEEYYGRWIQLLVKRQNESINSRTKNPSHQPPQSENDPREEETQTPTTTETEIESGTQNHTNPKMQSGNEEQAPTEIDYDIPTTTEEYESMADRFASIGITRSDLDKVLENRRTAFNKASREFNVREKKRRAEEAKANKKPRKNSLIKKTL